MSRANGWPRRYRRLLPHARAAACRIPEDQACSEYSAAHTSGSPVGKECAYAVDSCRVKPSVLRGFSGCQQGSGGRPWGRMLMPKAPLFWRHFDWKSIRDGGTIDLNVCAGSLPSLVAHRGHEGKHVSWPRRSRQAADITGPSRTIEHEVSPYRFVRAVKAFREEVTRVDELVRLRGRRKTRGKCSNGRPQDGRRDRRRP